MNAGGTSDPGYYVVREPIATTLLRTQCGVASLRPRGYNRAAFDIQR